MGVGVEFNEKLLQRLAQDSNGKYHFIGHPPEIPRIFEDELAGLRSVSMCNGRIELTLSQGVQAREAFRASPEIYLLGMPLVGEDRKIDYEIGDLQAGVPGSVLLTLVLPPRKPGQVRILQSTFHYEVPGGGEKTVECDLTVDYTVDRALTSKRNGRVMNLVDQVSIAKLQAKAEEELKAGNVDRATRLLGNALQGTQRMGNVKATQALSDLIDQIKKTQTLQTKAAKTALLQAQAVVRKTQMLDPDSGGRTAAGGDDWPRRVRRWSASRAASREMGARPHNPDWCWSAVEPAPLPEPPALTLALCNSARFEPRLYPYDEWLARQRRAWTPRGPDGVVLVRDPAGGFEPADSHSSSN
jgi:hypothetical protein